MPASSRLRATRSAPRLVRVKTIARVNVGIGEQLDQHVAFARRVDVDDLLLDPVDGRGRRRHRDFGRIVQQFAGELADVGRHGGGEEQVLPLARQFADDAADRPDEAEIEHLVDFVEDEEFDRARDWRRARRDGRRRRPGVATSTSRPSRQRADLRAVRHAAEDDGDVERQAGREVAKALGDLAGEFARRREHEHARPAARRRLLVGDQAVEDRQREGRRLAGAGLGDADQVAALHQDGNGLRLDRRRLGVAHLGQRGDERRGKAEAVEIFQVMIFQTAAKAREIPRGGLWSLKGTPRVSGRLGDLQTGARQEDLKPFTQPARIGRSMSGMRLIHDAAHNVKERRSADRLGRGDRIFRRAAAAVIRSAARDQPKL